jgi:hypothetical protein
MKKKIAKGQFCEHFFKANLERQKFLRFTFSSTFDQNKNLFFQKMRKHRIFLNGLAL